MAGECLSYLSVKGGGVYIDCTVGGAGHSLLILERLGGEGNGQIGADRGEGAVLIGTDSGESATLIGIDRDEAAAAVAESRLRARNAELGGGVRVEVVRSNYVDIDKICGERGISGADGILLDLGISSNQLGEAERGFSYRLDAPLDMRFDRSGGITAADVVNGYSERELADIFYKYGEERWAARIAAFIAERRLAAPIRTTGELAGAIFAAVPKGAREDRQHPARRVFMALRIFVNDELGVISETIKKAAALLKPGGRLCVISYHSLEDRIVKNAINELAAGCVCPKDLPVCVCKHIKVFKKLTGKPALPAEEEVRRNPRARSAKLRAAEKIGD